MLNGNEYKIIKTVRQPGIVDYAKIIFQDIAK